MGTGLAFNGGVPGLLQALLAFAIQTYIPQLLQ